MISNSLIQSAIRACIAFVDARTESDGCKTDRDAAQMLRNPTAVSADLEEALKVVQYNLFIDDRIVG